MLSKHNLVIALHGMQYSLLKMTLENDHYLVTEEGMDRAFAVVEEEDLTTIPQHVTETGSSLAI